MEVELVEYALTRRNEPANRVTAKLIEAKENCAGSKELLRLILSQIGQFRAVVYVVGRGGTVLEWDDHKRGFESQQWIPDVAYLTGLNDGEMLQLINLATISDADPSHCNFKINRKELTRLQAVRASRSPQLHSNNTHSP